jgi:N-acetylglucosaminyldiphosphoundecaprenol N-acetyl-beta-D-mannosaminyltransferase
VLYGKRISPIYGIEYAKAALQYSAEKDHRLFLLGGLSNRIPQLESSIMRDYPGIQLAGTHHGYLNEVEDPQLIVRQISQSNADILMVGMGSPRQEKWIWRNRHRLNIPVLIGVGGSFDVISGNKQDTPKWVRGSGFEWAYRTAGDPGSYWRRYLITNPWFLWQILSAKLRIR